jgi:hypothetical protein
VSNFWQTVLPTVLAALVAGRIAVTPHWPAPQGH